MSPKTRSPTATVVTPRRPHRRLTGNGPLDQIIQAGYAACTSALHGALYLSAALLAGAALLSAVTLRQRPQLAE